MTTIQIEKQTYDIIEGTQSDGRCFSASIFYDLYKEKANDEQLNNWIQQYIIEPILNTENTNCNQFFNWVTLWAGMPKHGTNISNFIIDNNVSILQNILERLDVALKFIKESLITIDTIGDLEQVLLDLNERIFVLISEEPFITFMNNNTQFKNFIEQLSNNIGELANIILSDTTRDKITTSQFIINNIDKLNELFVNNYDTTFEGNIGVTSENDIDQSFFFQEIVTAIENKIMKTKIQICEQIQYFNEYDLLSTAYKNYISSLNSKINGSYEWTEPAVGPIDVLLQMKNETKTTFIIFSINIFDSSDNKILKFPRNKRRNKRDTGDNLYLYYENKDHYKPLILTNIPDTNTNVPDTKVPDTKVPDTKVPDTKVPDTKVPDTNVPDTNTKIPNTKPIKPKIKPKPISISPKPILPEPILPEPTNNEPTNKEPIIPINKSIITNNSRKKIDQTQIPNSLIIYVKTRIPNAYKLNYEPYMTVPKSKSHTVYFDPLIKYYERPIQNIPSTAPKNTQYSQFFEAPEFDTMINRILSDFRYMQKKRSFQNAYDNNIIENNIKITINNLFRPNGLFYINKKPYTIVGVKSNPFNWQIDEKPLEKLLNHFSHLSLDQIKKQANEEKENIPEPLRQGNVASSNITSDENMSIITSSLQNTSDNTSKENIKKDIIGDINTFVDPDKLISDKDDYMYKLYTKYLRKNIPINYTNIPDITIDPLTFVLLIKPSDLIKFIKTDTNKHKKMLDLYSAYITSKKNLKNTDIKYNDKCIELAINKKEYDKEMYNIGNYFLDIKENNTYDDDKNKTEKIERIISLKVGYMSFIFELADIINEIYTSQTVYFTATKELLIEIKQNYLDIVQNDEETTLAFECLDNDISTVQLLISEDSANKCSQKYFSNYYSFKQIYKHLNTKKKDILEPKINYTDEIEFYTNNPAVLNIEIKLYEIYNFQMFLFYSYNQCDIWVLLFKTNQTLTSNIFEKSTAIIKNYEVSKNIIDDPKYKKYQEDINKTTVHIVPSKKNNKSSETSWILENENGEKIIKNNDKNGKKFQKLYIDYIKKSVNAFDIVVLYIYLLEKYCLLQSRVYISEANIIYINIDYEKSLDSYYIEILDYIEYNKKQEIFIPSSILWKTDDLNKIDVIDKKRATHDKKLFIYYNRIRSIEKSREKILLLCQEFYKQITPNISKKAFIKLCNDMINKQETIIEPYSFGNTINTIYDDIEKYDIVKINEFNYNIDRLVDELYYDRVINEDDNIKSYFDWMVFRNDNKNDNKSKLSQVIADGLNRQLELTENTTTNKYTEKINGKQIFTTNSLIKMINEKKPLNSINININEMISIWEKYLGIKLIIFEMFTRPENTNINIGDMVLYKGLTNDYKPHRVLSKQPNNTGTDVTYNLYDGLNIFENIENTEQTIEKNVLNELGQFVKTPITIKTIKKDLSRNYLEYFRVYCDTIDNNDFDKYDDYMYIVLTENTYQLVRDIDNDYIIKKDQIPNYIRYLIYNSCPKLRDDQYFSDFKNKINENINSDDIDKEIFNIQEKIKEKENMLDDEYENGEDNEENDIKKNLITKEINKLEKLLKNLENKKRAKITKGGNPDQKLSEQYSQNISNYPVGVPRNVIYYPQQQYLPPGYLPPRYNQQMLPYFSKQNNVIQNKAKDQKSKLSFYIEIELELYPGTSVNLFQKGVVKCQSTFERIREAWADIRGVEYRPSPMNEAYSYAYNIKNEQQKNKTLKTPNNNNNKKTLKKYPN